MPVTAIPGALDQVLLNVKSLPIMPLEPLRTLRTRLAIAKMVSLILLVRVGAMGVVASTVENRGESAQTFFCYSH